VKALRVSSYLDEVRSDRINIASMLMKRADPDPTHHLSLRIFGADAELVGFPAETLEGVEVAANLGLHSPADGHVVRELRASESCRRPSIRIERVVGARGVTELPVRVVAPSMRFET